MFAYGGIGNGVHWWWIIPLIMMILCFLMMHGRRSCMMTGAKSRTRVERCPLSSSDSAREILDKRYALGEISKAEYEEKKREMGI